MSLEEPEIVVINQQPQIEEPGSSKRKRSAENVSQKLSASDKQRDI